jgi:hypothetical protein
MEILAGFANVSLAQLLLVAAVALLASIIGGVSGYGTGALMPLVLVPLVGAEPVVPIIAISALFTNSSRVFAFLKYADWRRAAIVLAASVPTCVLGAWGYAPFQRRRSAGDRRDADCERACGGSCAITAWSATGLGRVLWAWPGGGRHGRVGRDPAIAADGGRRRRGGCHRH